MQFQPFKTGSSVARSERGAYIIATASLVIGLLLFAGLALDSARLFWAKRQLQAAVDAAVVAGGNILATQPNLNIRGAAPSAEAFTRSILKENLLRMHFDLATADSSSQNANICFGPTSYTLGGCVGVPSTDPGSDSRGIRLAAQINQPTLLISLLPGLSGFNLVAATSVVQNLRLKVALVLDDSYSMRNQPLPNPTPDDMTCANPYNCNRLDGLKYAANKFLETLLPSDRVGIIKFSFNYPNSGDVMDLTLDDGLNYEDKFLNDSKVIQPLTQMVDAGGSHLQSMQTKVDDELRGFWNTDIGSGIKRGNDMIIPAGTTLGADELPVMVVVTDGAPALDDSDTDRITMYTRESIGPQPISSLCNRFAGREGEVVHFQNGQNSYLPLPRTTIDPYIQRRRFNILDAIEEADKARNAGILVYTIGVGVPDTFQGAAGTTPFQSMGDLQHPLLLYRVANDQAKLVDPPSISVPPYPPVDFRPPGFAPYFWDFPCVASGRDLVNKPVGKYFDARNGTALLNAFREISGQIRGKLYQ